MEYLCAAHQSLLAFDLETVPATENSARLCVEGANEAERQSRLIEHFGLDRNGRSAFPPAAFHQIVAIGFLSARIERVGEQEWYILERFGARVAGLDGEKDLLERFLQFAGTLRPRLISFNGRAFDLPVLRARAMRHGISADWLYDRGRSSHSYQTRYRSDCHCDLLETLTDHGASMRIKLHEACVALGLPGKLGGVDGASVAELHRSGEYELIRDYCESYVLNTYLLYLRHMLHRGALSAENHACAETELAARLEAKGEEKEWVAPFLEIWQRLGSPAAPQTQAAA